MLINIMKIEHICRNKSNMSNNKNANVLEVFKFHAFIRLSYNQNVQQ